MSTRACGALVLVVLAAAPNSAGAAHVTPSRPTAPVGPAQTARIGPAPARQSLQLVLPLKADLVGLEGVARAITTPGSVRYGAYESLAQLARQFGASPSTRRRVAAYLRQAGASDVGIDPTGLFVDATMSATVAQRLFATPLGQFRTARGAGFVAPNVRMASAASINLPAGLRGLVSGVVGLDTRPVAITPMLRADLRTGHPASSLPSLARVARQLPSALPRTGTPSGCSRGQGSGGFTPNQFLTAYGYDRLRQAGVAGQGERVALIEIDGFKYSDIQTFARCFGLSIPALNGVGVGVSKRLPPGGEATLDLEVLDAAAPGLGEIDVFETRSSAADTLKALTAPLRMRQKPRVVSASLGLCEPVLRQLIGNSGIRSTEAALEMAAASGITFLASSGDQGSADCTATNDQPIRLRAVNYPASSWWVTGVGGTNLALNAANQIDFEVVWNDAALQPGSASGGGTSVLFGRPGYQVDSVHSRRRGVPDVSMLSDVAPGYAIYCSVARDCINASNPSPWLQVGGTSAATPLMAGGFALVDQELRSQHREPLGLANPLLYSIARSSASSTVFHDVTAIGNDVGPYIPGNKRPLGCCSAGVGYDEASGLGSVNIGSFAARALAAQPMIVNVALALPSQHPVRQHQILATMACSGPCLIGARAAVVIGRSKAFGLDSRVYRLRAAGVKTIALSFSPAELKRLGAALGHHQRVVTVVRGLQFDPTAYGVLPKPSRSIRAETDLRRLTIAR